MRNTIKMVYVSVLFYYLSSFSCIKVAGLDRITAEEPIADGQTIVSAGGNFELGFFSPGSSKNRYVGIWYKKISIRTVVWVANRERPVIDSTGTLMINNVGDLVIMDWKGNSILIGYGSGSGTNTSAKLLDDGNLIHGEGNLNMTGKVLWQSFDYPTDVFLPGMKLGRDLKSKRNRFLTSWRSPDDPAPGIYSLGLDPNGTEQFFIWNKGVKYWTSGMWNGEIFSMVPEMRLNYIFNFTYVSTDDERYFTYSLYNSSIISRLVIDFTGQINQYTWTENPNLWNLFWRVPRDVCDVYSPCGSYGICGNTTLRSLSCTCLLGFQPVTLKDWASSIWSGGCERKTELKCGNPHKFLQLRRMNLPDQMKYVPATHLDTKNCENMCMASCSCIAYTTANSTGCFFWDNDLIGIRENSDKQDLFIRIAAPGINEGNGKVRILVITLVTSTLALVFSGFILFFLRRRRGIEREKEDKILMEIGTIMGPARNFDNGHTLEGDKNDSDLRLFSFANITAATDNFAATNKLGEGGFGPVYKGKLPDGREIAVKRLSIRSKQGLEEFKNEIILIAKLQHMNLVRLFGCCIQVEEKMLIYEYMRNNSLDSFLFDPTKRVFLDWGKRVNIVEGIAQGILYLHRYSRLRIIHRDLKASNVLLDCDMNPKISDFGMARIFGNNESEANTNRVVGTYGYMSPEYAMEGIFSIKSDVFSFGVLLLEIMAGKKSTSFEYSDCSLSLLGYAWELWKEGRGIELIDPMIVDSASLHELMKYVNVGLLCVQESPVDRPTMQEVISMLSSKTGSVLPIPKQAAFFISRSTTETGLDTANPGTGSVNELTVSLMKAR